MIRWVLGLVLFWGVFIQHPPIDRISYNVYWKVIKANRLCPNIHYGGCGWFALYLQGYFEGVGVKSTIVFCGQGGEIPQHIFVKNKYGYWDNKGLFTKFAVVLWFRGDISEKTPQDLKNILKKSGWNTQFKVQDTVIVKQVL